MKKPAAELQMPEIGDVVTVTCTTFSQEGIPVAPKVLRIRQDVVWDDVASDPSFNGKNNLPNGITITKHEKKMKE